MVSLFGYCQSLKTRQIGLQHAMIRETEIFRTLSLSFVRGALESFYVHLAKADQMQPKGKCRLLSRKACNQWLLPIASIASIYRKYNMRLPAHSPAGPILRQGPSPFLRQICCCCISMVPPSKPLHVDGDMEGSRSPFPNPQQKKRSYSRTPCSDRNSKTNPQPPVRQCRSQNCRRCFWGSCLRL